MTTSCSHLLTERTNHLVNSPTRRPVQAAACVRGVYARRDRADRLTRWRLRNRTRRCFRSPAARSPSYVDVVGERGQHPPDERPPPLRGAGSRAVIGRGYDNQQWPFDRAGEHAESAAKQGGTVPFQFGFRHVHSRGAATHADRPVPTSAATHPLVNPTAYASRCNSSSCACPGLRCRRDPALQGQSRVRAGFDARRKAWRCLSRQSCSQAA